MQKMTASTTEFFINPYNFVDFSRQPVERKPRSEADDVLSGWLDCTLTVAQDGMLALPDQTNAVPATDANGRPIKESKVCDFFKIDGKPVITGSELRGCIRSVFEAVTSSCFSVINNDFLSARKSRPDKTRTAGIAVFDPAHDCWLLYPAEKVTDGRADDTVKRVWEDFKKKNGKTSTSFYRKTSNNPVTQLTDVQINNFVSVLEIYEENNPKFKSVYHALLDRIEQEQPFVAFYEMRNSSLAYFSPAHTGRFSYENTVKSLLVEYAPCDGKDGCLCPACRLFGTLQGERATASRLRFTDALADSVVLSEKPVNLPELSAPKITSAEFYALPPENYLQDIEIYGYDDDGVSLRGRKFYFHSKPRCLPQLGERSVATTVAKGGSSFLFRVYFDRICDTELQQLIWTLTLGENTVNSKKLHKLGFGKPTGFGSVKILADRLTVRTVSGAGETLTYRLKETKPVVPQSADALFGAKNYSVEDLLAIADYDFLKGQKHPVTYPLADNGKNDANSSAAHQWFIANRNTKGNFSYILPTLQDSLKLPKMIAAQQPSYGGNQPRKLPDAQGPRCTCCGNAVSKNPKTGKWNRLCYDCFKKQKQ